MQNNQSKNWKQIWKDKGYYIVLALLILVVGVAGTTLITGVVREKQAVEESLAAPVPVELPPQQIPEDPEGPEAQVTEPAAAEAQVPETVPEQAVLPVSGIVLQDYAMDHLCYNPTTEDWRVHNGVDLAAPFGEPVQAAKSGTVTAVYEDEYLGVTVVVDHGDGWVTHYCNLQQDPHTAAGDVVQVGQVIGAVGDTALIEVAAEPHLHFEVYQNGTPVDPAGFLY